MKIEAALGRTAAALCVALLLGTAAQGGDGSSSSTAGAPRLTSIVKSLQRHYRSTSSFRARFKEQITTAGGARREREGAISYRKPGRMRWEFGPPELETIVSDGTTLYVYEPDLNQVVETPLRRAFRSSAPAALLLGMGDIERDFVASRPPAAPADGLLHLSLKSKADGALVALALDPKTYDVAALSVTDALGNVTAISFSDIHTNVPTDASLFTFKVPDGVDVVTAPGTS